MNHQHFLFILHFCYSFLIFYHLLGKESLKDNCWIIVMRLKDRITQTNLNVKHILCASATLDKQNLQYKIVSGWNWSTSKEYMFTAHIYTTCKIILRGQLLMLESTKRHAFGNRYMYLETKLKVEKEHNNRTTNIFVNHKQKEVYHNSHGYCSDILSIDHRWV